MARCGFAGRGVTNLPTTVTGPTMHAGASNAVRIREIGVFNTTTTGFAVGVALTSGAGALVGALTGASEDDPGRTLAATSHTSMTSTPTVVATIRQASVGAAVGAGVIFTFGDNGLQRTAGTANGVILTCPTGTAQFFDFYFVFDE
jgi:hypothetical protein